MAGTDPEILWKLVEWTSDLFYDPVVFWGAPLLLAIVWTVMQRLR